MNAAKKMDADDYAKVADEKRRQVASLIRKLEQRLIAPHSSRLEALALGLGDSPRSATEQFEASPFPFLVECAAVGFYIGKLAARK